MDLNGMLLLSVLVNMERFINIISDDVDVLRSLLCTR